MTRKTLDNITTTFPWGKVVEVHTAGEFVIVENLPHIIKDGHKTGRYEEGEPNFHAFIRLGEELEDTHASFATMEEAMAFAIAYKWDGPNTQAATLFCRALGIIPVPNEPWLDQYARRRAVLKGPAGQEGGA